MTFKKVLKKFILNTCLCLIFIKQSELIRNNLKSEVSIKFDCSHLTLFNREISIIIFKQIVLNIKKFNSKFLQNVIFWGYS